jgi:cytochrome c5
MSIKAMVNKRISRLLSVALAALAVSLAAVAGTVEDGIAERIQPVGTVCVKGDDCASNLSVAAAEAKSGEEIYNTSCLACHASGAAGAPKFRDAAQWAPRLAAGLESLYTNSINGMGAMPAKGLCMACSDEELKSAVDYMIEGL